MVTQSDMNDSIKRWVENASKSVPEELQEKFRKLVSEFLIDLLSGERTPDEMIDKLDESFIEEMIKKGQNPLHFIERIDAFYEMISEINEDEFKRLSPILAKFETKFLKKVLKIYARIISEKDRKKAKIERALKILAEVSNSIMESESEEELLNKVCKIIVETGKYQHAWVAYPEKGGMEVVTRYGIAIPGLTESESDVRWIETSTNAVMKTGKPIITRNVFKDPNFYSWRAISLKKSLNYLLSLPVKQGSEIYGVLNIYVSNEEGFDDEELDLLSKLTENLSFAISKMRTEVEKERIDRLYRLLLDNTGTGVALLDGEKIMFVNRKMENLLGYPKDEIVGRRFDEFVHEGDKERVRRIHVDVADNLYFRSVSYNVTYINSKRDLRQGMVLLTKLPDDNRLIVSLIDTTDLMLATRQIEENIETFANLVDKIRNPLTAIYGFVDEYATDERVKKVVFEQIDRIIELIERLEDGWIDTDGIKTILKESKNRAK